jgi:hypothetical protein
MRFRSADGQWTIDAIRLSLTGTGRDGEQLRISHLGFFIAEVRSVDELRRYVELAELHEA